MHRMTNRTFACKCIIQNVVFFAAWLSSVHRAGITFDPSINRRETDGDCFYRKSAELSHLGAIMTGHSKSYTRTWVERGGQTEIPAAGCSMQHA